MKLNNRHNAVKKIKNLIFTQKSDPIPFRKTIEKTFASYYLPNNVECMQTELSGISCDILLPEISAKDRVIVYVHGGSFVGGSKNSWRSFCASLANDSTTKLYLPEISLAPEHPFPAAIEDILKILNNLLITCKKIVLCADSSACSIALATVMNLSKAEKQKIQEIVLLSPWLDLSYEAQIFNQKKVTDEVLSVDSLRRCADVYTYKSNLINPMVSPLLAKKENMLDFPKIFIQCGEKELLIDQVQTFNQMMYRFGVECELDIWPNMMSLFQFADEYLQESHLAIEKIGKHIQERE